MKTLVTIENATIDALLRHPQAVSLLPSLKQVRELRHQVPCPRCDATAKAADRAATYNRAKEDLASLRGDALKAMKQLLGAQKLRVRVHRGNRVEQYTL